ncbi:hypothetical protein CCACVL1_29127, partial [Corchorus capsularis]
QSKSHPKLSWDIRQKRPESRLANNVYVARNGYFKPLRIKEDLDFKVKGSRRADDIHRMEQTETPLLV